MGGGGFSAGDEDPGLDQLVLDLTGAREPRIALLPTAGGDSERQIQRFYASFGDRLCEPSHISLFRRGQDPMPLEERLLGQDAIYVGGGSMVNLLAIWRAQGLPEILREAWRAGIVLAGISAGAMCWFDHGVTTSLGRPTGVRGLGFLPGTFSVHHDSEPSRRPVLLNAVGTGALPEGWAADDGVGLLFRYRRLDAVVSPRPDARAWRVCRDAAGAHEEEIEPRRLAAVRKEHAAPPAAISELRHVHAARAARGRHGLRRVRD
jgi:dipeptidase E